MSLDNRKSLPQNSRYNQYNTIDTVSHSKGKSLGRKDSKFISHLASKNSRHFVVDKSYINVPTAQNQNTEPVTDYTPT